MKEFKIEITEILQKNITIEADSKTEAIKMAKSWYQNEKVILDSSNLIDVIFEELLETK